MRKPNVAQFVGNIRKSMVEHSPEILTGLGITGMVATTVLAVSATPKALQLLELKRQEEDVERTKFETVKHTVKTCWKCYIPSAVTGTMSIACLIGASSVNARRNAALAAAYTLSDTALREYREKVVETLGEKKEQAIREKVAEEQIKNDPVSKKEVIITNIGKTLCYDSISKRYFESDIDKIKKAENKLNKRMFSEMYISLNEFYGEIGLEEIGVGDDLGWNVDELIDLYFSSHIADDGRPCIVIEYQSAPKYNYSKLM